MNDTFSPAVAAVSTPYGRGGIAVLRVSGDGAVGICARVFQPANGKPLSDIEPNRAVFGRIYYDGEQIDDGMATVFYAPHSFTGEDTVEISCHGGILLTQKVLESLFMAGAAPAGPGEFTKRAFLNGKIGLSQAEAVIDVIDAESMEKLRLAGAAARGALSRKSDEIHALLKAALSSTYAFIDFPDEDLTDMTVGELTDAVSAAREKLVRLKQSYTRGKAVNEGIRTAIVGRPNTGKSSLLNALLGEDRAIVTDIAGTTRDVISETVVLGRILLRLADTAGIRGTDDPVEQLGVQRSVAALDEAELVIAVFDCAQPFTEDDFALAEKLKSLSCPVIAAANKNDLSPVSDPAKLGVPFAKTVSLSAKSGAGLDTLRTVIEEMFASGEIDYGTDGVLANARQYAAVQAALSHTEDALHALSEGFTQDIAGMDLELALSALGELDGRSVSGEIVDAIFHNFCVGK